MTDYVPRYRPRPGSKTEKAIGAIRESGGLSCPPLAELLDCDPRNVRNFLEIPIKRGLLDEEHRSGLLFFVIADEPEAEANDGPVETTKKGIGMTKSESEATFIADEFGPAAPAADAPRKRTPIDFPVAAYRDPDDHSGPTYGIYSDGRLVVTSEEGDIAIVFQKGEAARLRHDLNAIFGSPPLSAMEHMAASLTPAD